MPMYTVSSATPIDADKRQPLANLIMRTHCDLTGAPETFVQVVYSFGVPLNKSTAIHVFGNVRKGRTLEANETLVSTLKVGIAELLSLAEVSVEAVLFEVPASWIMEGGEVLPEPGEEDECEWLHGEAS